MFFKKVISLFVCLVFLFCSLQMFPMKKKTTKHESQKQNVIYVIDSDIDDSDDSDEEEENDEEKIGELIETVETEIEKMKKAKKPHSIKKFLKNAETIIAKIEEISEKIAERYRKRLSNTFNFSIDKNYTVRLIKKKWNRFIKNRRKKIKQIEDLDKYFKKLKKDYKKRIKNIGEKRDVKPVYNFEEDIDPDHHYKRIKKELSQKLMEKLTKKEIDDDYDNDDDDYEKEEEKDIELLSQLGANRTLPTKTHDKENDDDSETESGSEEEDDDDDSDSEDDDNNDE